MSDIPVFWRRQTLLAWLLWPVSCFVWLVVILKRRLYRLGVFKHYQAPVPVIVIGNITVGGNGKTPVVMALAQCLTRHGYQVGVVSRGYGGNAQTTCEVCSDSSAKVVGDETLMIKQRCQVPVFISKKRAEAVAALFKQYAQVQVIISDDGLQHYALGRSLEWVVIARDMGFGNGFLLPAGPMREPIRRLMGVDNVLLHGQGDFALPDNLDKNKVWVLEQINGGLRRLTETNYQPITRFGDYDEYVGLTAIARPERFFQTLTALGIIVTQTKALPDHAMISPKEADFASSCYIIITEKDAVKTQNWPYALKARTLVLAHDLVLPSALINTVCAHIDSFQGKELS